jgi:hypothetical protein
MGADLYWLEQYRRYVAEIEAYIRRLDESFPLSAEDRASLIAHPVRELDLPVGIEDLQDATSVFPSVLRRSGFLLLFTLLESTLHRLARTVQQREVNPVGVDDFRGSGFSRIVRYLKLVAELDLAQYPEWPEVQRFQQLRNALVHHNGIIEAREAAHPITDYVRGAPSLSLEETFNGHVLQLGPGFCEHAANVAESFLNRIPAAAWSDRKDPAA